MNIGTFHLHPVLQVTDDGQVRLEGTNVRVLTAGVIGAGDVGRLAVCQRIQIDNVPAVIVLGLLAGSEEATDADAPLEISHGQASLRLYPDGRIEMKGEAITMDSATRLKLLAARIDLN